MKIMLRICSGIARSLFQVGCGILMVGSIYHGTASDTSLLIDHLGSYILLEQDDPPIDRYMVLGISLGGHSAWQVLFSEPRVTAGVVIIGCPDYISKFFQFRGFWCFLN